MPVFELDLKNLGPFDQIHFEFDSNINLFVGPNNCGKSTTLMALADIAVYPFVVPTKLLRKEDAEFRVLKGPTSRRRQPYEGVFPIELEKGFWGKKRSDAWVKSLVELGYTCLIPALRRSTDYRAESAASEKRKEGNGEKSKKSTKVEHDLTKREKIFFKASSSAVRDEVLIQKIIDLDYRGYRQENPAVREIIGKIAKTASEITDGFPIEFLRVAEDDKGLYPEFMTPDGKLPLNCLSQGTQSIIQWLGLLLIGYAEYYNFPKKLENKRGVVIIDEIDAHMHPSWQRRILPALSRNFPKLQIFCSAHSPLVLAGLKAGQAHLLKRDSKGKVVVLRNQSDIVGWSTDEILRNFLDITNPTDLQTSESIDRLQQLRRKRRPTQKQKQEIEILREKVRERVHSGPIASEVERFSQFIQKHPPVFQSPKTAKTSKKVTKASTKNKRRVKTARKGKAN